MTRTRTVLYRSLTGLVALALVAVVGAQTGAASTSQTGAQERTSPAVALEVDEAGTYRLNTVTLGPGASWWSVWYTGNASYFIDVRPIATTVTTECKIEVEREIRSQVWNADNTRSFRVEALTKNVGTATCKFDVYLGYVH